MAVISNYATLQTEVANFLAREDLTNDIPLFIQLAENKLRRILNLRNEETALNVTISSGVATVPTDFKALKLAYFNASPARLLRWVSLNELYNDYPYRSDSDIPRVISREAGNFVFGPVSVDGTLNGVYYAKQDPLRTTSPSWYSTNAPEVLLYGSLLEAAPFIHNDERIPVWRQMYLEAVDTLRVENENAENAQSSIVQRVS